MEIGTEDSLAQTYFSLVALGAAILAWWFLTRPDKLLRMFGFGMAGYAAGLLLWTVLIFVQPGNLQPLALAGAIPFLLAHLVYAKVAYGHLGGLRTKLMLALVLALIVGTFVVRTFIYPSEPYLSDQGLLFFGLHPLAIAFYIATISLTFLPAISIACSRIKRGGVRNALQAGLTALFITEIILASSDNEILLAINGVAMTLALLACLLFAITSTPEDLKQAGNKPRKGKQRKPRS